MCRERRMERVEICGSRSQALILFNKQQLAVDYAPFFIIHPGFYLCATGIPDRCISAFRQGCVEAARIPTRKHNRRLVPPPPRPAASQLQTIAEQHTRTGSAPAVSKTK